MKWFCLTLTLFNFSVLAFDLDDQEFAGSCVSKYSYGKVTGCKNKPLTGYSCENHFTPAARTVCKLVGGRYFAGKRCEHMGFKMCLGKRTLPYWYMTTNDDNKFSNIQSTHQ